MSDPSPASLAEAIIDRIRARLRTDAPIPSKDPFVTVVYDGDRVVAILAFHSGEGATDVEALQALECSVAGVAS